MKWNLNIERSARDKRLLSLISNLVQESGIILELPFEDSDKTGPFCNHLTFLEHKKLRKITLEDLVAGNYILRATDATPWTQREADTMDQVFCPSLEGGDGVCMCVCVCVGGGYLVTLCCPFNVYAPDPSIWRTLALCTWPHR